MDSKQLRKYLLARLGFIEEAIREITSHKYKVTQEESIIFIGFKAQVNLLEQIIKDLESEYKDE